MRLYKHIETLLVRHDYVVVPGLGGFALQNKPATIAGEHITPPASVIGFNPLMQHSDGLLAIEVSRKEDISYRKAVELIEQEIKNFQAELLVEDAISFGNLGKFKKTADGNLLFTPTEFAAFLPANIGLHPVAVSSVKRKKEIVTIQFRRNTIFKYAAAIALIIGLLFVSPQLNNFSTKQSAGFIPLNLKTENSSNRLKKSTNISITKQNIKTNTAASDSLSIIKIKPKRYHVIVASLNTQKSADDYCAYLQDCGYRNANVLDPAKTYKVALQSFKNKDEAISYMEYLRATDERFETAWVFCN